MSECPVCSRDVRIPGAILHSPDCPKRKSEAALRRQRLNSWVWFTAVYWFTAGLLIGWMVIGRG